MSELEAIEKHLRAALADDKGDGFMLTGAPSSSSARPTRECRSRTA